MTTPLAQWVQQSFVLDPLAAEGDEWNAKLAMLLQSRARSRWHHFRIASAFIQPKSLGLDGLARVENDLSDFFVVEATAEQIRERQPPGFRPSGRIGVIAISAILLRRHARAEVELSQRSALVDRSRGRQRRPNYSSTTA
jgi:hypothetical protein